MASRQRPIRQAQARVTADIVLLGCGHAHLSALRRWRAPRPPIVVTRAQCEAYSGRVPAVLRGERASADLPLGRDVARVGGVLVVGECVSIHLVQRELRLADGRAVPFGLLSLDLGATSAAPPGAIPVRPAATLPSRVAALDTAPPGPIAVVGGGAAGVEVALALAQRWRRDRAIFLVCPGEPLPGAPAAVRRQALAALTEAGVSLVAGRAAGVDGGNLALQDGHVLATVAVLWAAGLAASPLPEAAGLACDASGFIRVDRCLRSVSHQDVFAGGDGAASGAVKSGTYAVADGRALADNLARAACGKPAVPWPAPTRALAAIGLGHGRGLAWRGPFWCGGRPAWWLKCALDRRWCGQSP